MRKTNAHKTSGQGEARLGDALSRKNARTGLGPSSHCGRRLPDVGARPGQLRFRTESVTGASPEKPSARAPAGVRSITRPRTNGPRSLILTTTDLLLRRLVTCTLVPNGSVLCAAVRAPGWARSPFAVFRPA